jgi:hypothetical protein
MFRFAVALGTILLLLSEAAAAGAAPSDAITLRFTPCGGMICIPVTLSDGRSHQLLLDSGDINSWFMADTARGLGLTLEPVERDGNTVPGVFRLGQQSVSLAGRAFPGRFLALGREQVGEQPPEVEGALTYTLFKDKVLEIDYPHRTVRVLDPPPQAAAGPSGADLKLITFGKAGPPIVVGSGFSVDGRAVNAQIDTCYTGTLLVYDQAIGVLGLERAAAQGRPRYFPYTDGGVNMNAAATDSIAFGRYVLSRHPATVYFPGQGTNPVHQPDGLFEATVGNALFAHSVVTLDFHSMKVSVRPG